MKPRWRLRVWGLAMTFGGVVTLSSFAQKPNAEPAPSATPAAVGGSGEAPSSQKSEEISEGVEPSERGSNSTEPPSLALAEIELAEKPAYQVSCRASAGLRENKSEDDVKPPSAAQLAAMELLGSEAALYEASAQKFQQQLASIVRHHYEERRQRVVAAIEQEVQLQKTFLNQARDTAIQRLEAFVARYKGEQAHPHSTPDAMLRLAALYEERARQDFDADLEQELKPAIALYRDIAVQFPAYEEVAAALYYLGHTLIDSGRLEEAQQAWRSLVCSNHYQVQIPSDSSDGVVVQTLGQDHDDAFWNEWYNKNPLPLDEAGARPDLSQLGVSEEELVFVDPYLACEAVPQKLKPGAEPRYVAEIWWQIGNHHFDHLDPRGGPYNLNRAVSAYTQSLKYERPPLYGVAMYKQAWALFKQQRYESAIEHFVSLLRYADEEEARTGDPGADFRKEAFTYIAGSLTYVDMLGPPPEDPFIARNDVLDTELDPILAEEMMSLAIRRVQDPKLIPQEEKWTVGIYKALAREFIEISQEQNAISTMELTLEKFPMDRDAPDLTNRVAEIYDELSRLAKPGSESRTEYAKKALAARSQLADYVGTTPWTDANQEDLEAIAQAELYAQVGLQRAAADHTNYGRAYKEGALRLSDAKSQKELLERAIEEYRLAAEGWGAYLAQNPNAVDAYESNFWLADAHFWIAVLQVPLGRMPSSAEVAQAYEHAAEVRDSNADDKYKQPAAYFAVALTEKILDAEAKAFEESGGRQGIERKEAVAFHVDADGGKAIRTEKMPAAVQAAVCARDEYNAAISLEDDPEENGLLYATQAAEYFFVYGQFAEAQRRFLPIYQHYCGKNKWGYNAWEKLVSMSNFTGDAKTSRSLVESRNCSFDEESRKSVEAIVTPVKIGVAYMEAGRLFKEALVMKDGPERDNTWRQAAAAYKVALDVAPDRDEAPEAVMNGAFAYKQVGEYDKAIAMYELFIKTYGNEQTLSSLRAIEGGKYEERVRFLADAYEALAGAYVLFFDYPRAAETFDAISSVEHFPVVEKKQAVKQGLMLYVNLDDRSGMERMSRRYSSLGAGAEELAEAEFLIATAVVKKWDPNSPDKGANQTARFSAEKSMSHYHDVNKDRAAAARYVVQAAYKTAQAKSAGGSPVADPWWRNTIEAFDKYLASAPRKDGKSEAVGSEEAGMAAEAAYRLIDKELKKDFDYDTGHHRYQGTVVEVIAAYANDAKDAKLWYDKLQIIVDRFVSPKWAAVAIARQGSVYDSLRTGLYNTRPPELKMFTAQQEKSLRIAEESDNLDLVDQADEIRFQVRQGWTKKRDQELDSADRIVADRYAVSVMLAQRYNLSHDAITRSIRRLAFLTDVAGEAKMSEYVSRNKDLVYQAGMFQRLRPGVISPPQVNALPRPSTQGAP
jgi:hypothetical protein